MSWIFHLLWSECSRFWVTDAESAICCQLETELSFEIEESFSHWSDENLARFSERRLSWSLQQEEILRYVLPLHQCFTLQQSAPQTAVTLQHAVSYQLQRCIRSRSEMNVRSCCRSLPGLALLCRTLLLCLIVCDSLLPHKIVKTLLTAERQQGESPPHRLLIFNYAVFSKRIYKSLIYFQ